MKVRGSGAAAEKIEPQMAPMIDVVFQLLIFFMLTLKIIEPEGDFSINMPQGKPSADPTQDVTIQPLDIHMRTRPDGSLASLQFGVNPALKPPLNATPVEIDTYIKLNESELLNREQARARIGEDKLFTRLNDAVAKYVHDQSALQPDKVKLEKELKAKITFDYNLNHRYLIKATSACRGRMRIVGGEERPEELIKNIEFVRPAEPGAKSGG
jgi:Biopolymer transport protein ExbD/TolR